MTAGTGSGSGTGTGLVLMSEKERRLVSDPSDLMLSGSTIQPNSMGRYVWTGSNTNVEKCFCF